MNLGYDSEVILAGRYINDDMAKYVARKVVQHIIKKCKQCKISKSVGNGSNI